ncbi:MAG: PilZ domain-containing protein [Treponema sp.]|nr:PilZ domain-containing protein [Treponema sp.]
MPESRINPRYRTFAYGRIHGIMEGNNLLKNISITGCCIECAAQVDNIQPDTEYQLEIKPERAAHIGKFKLLVERKWIRSEDSFNEVGFNIIAFPKGKLFQRYVDYLAFRSSETNATSEN